MAISKPQEFLTVITACKSISDVVAKGKAENAYLNREYATIASLKNGFTAYRNYLKANISINKKLSRKPLLETILNELRLTPEQQTSFNQVKHIDIKANKSNLREIYNIDAYLKVASGLLDSKSYLDNILGLCALTGRRVAEIGCTAEFKYIDKQVLEFAGQLKTKERLDVAPYQIPTLFNATKLMQALAKIREVKKQFIDEPELFHNATSKDLSVRVKKHFSGLFEGEPKVKDLRAIYALISFTNFSKVATNKRVDRDVYFSSILGHSKDDITTCGSYVDFFINA
jgi:hypothetical protein